MLVYWIFHHCVYRCKLKIFAIVQLMKIINCIKYHYLKNQSLARLCIQRSLVLLLRSLVLLLTGINQENVNNKP